MENKELYLKTMFCCLACDGEIAQVEIDTVNEVAKRNSLFEDVDVESVLNGFVSSVNQEGTAFPANYLKELAEAELSAEEEMTVVDFAIEIIEADKVIKYSEVKFFKKIRAKLSHLSDEDILEKYPDDEEFLLPDIHVDEAPDWSSFTFADIKVS